MNKQRRFFVRNFLKITDIIVICISYGLAYLLRNKFSFGGLESLFPFYVYFPYMFLVLGIWIVLLRLFDNYSFLRGVLIRKSRWSIFLNLIPVEITGLSLLSLTLYFVRDRNISRSFLLLFTIINYILLAGVKQLVISVFGKRINTKRYTRKVLLIGHKRRVDDFFSMQEGFPELLLEVIMIPELIIPDNVSLDVAGLNDFNSKIMNYIWNNVVDEVILIYNDIDLTKFASLISDCSKLGIGINLVLDMRDIDFRKTEADTIGKYNVLSFQSYDYKPSQRFMKRLVDIFGGMVGSFFFLVLYVFAGLTIKLTSKGSVLFVQKRKGKNGREFDLYKFRTMYVDAEERKKEIMDMNEMQGFIFKIKNDPRITPVGRFLRKTSLDEFPQFINILKGDMSLVGTRPPTLEEYDKYLAHHRRRLSVQPGLTGMWQVSGRNKITDFEEIVKLDTEYIDNWSIWLDLKIILKTFVVMFTGR